MTRSDRKGARPAGGKRGPKGGGKAGAKGGGRPSPASAEAAAALAGVEPARGAYLLHGLHAGAAALANPARRIGRVWATRQAAERVGEALHARDLRPLAADRTGLDALVGAEAVHQGLVIETWPLDQPALEDVAAAAGPATRVLLLDQVTDPHNVGAILRSAAVFGAAAVCLQDRHAPAEGAVLAKAASGMLERVPLVRIGNLARALATLKDAGFWVAGLDGEATATLQDLPADRPLGLVLGAEGAGLRRLTRETCDLTVRIPMAPAGPTPEAAGPPDGLSLNVSNAAAVALYAALPPDA